LASIALTSTCRHRTVIRTSAPKAINLDLNKFANLQNKLKYKTVMKYKILLKKLKNKKKILYLATISFSFNEAAPKTLEAVATVMK